MTKISRLVFSAMLVAIAVLVPSIFHIFALSGNIFLPMHLPVLVAGFWLGWQYGLSVGLCAPLLNSVLTGMPVMAKVPFMTVELAGYGLFAGLFYVTLRMKNLRYRSFNYGIYLALLITLALGRCVNAVALTVGTYILNINCGTAVTVIYSMITGIPGIIVQLVLVPILVAFIKSRTSDKTLF